MVLQDRLDQWRDRFSVLEQANWSVIAVDDGEYNGRCFHNTRDRVTEVCPCAEGDDPDDYALHEVLHAAMRVCALGGREEEETFVQNLCKVISER